MTPRELKDYYNSKEFENLYNYDGELGAVTDKNGTSVKLWSPLADKVKIRFYDKGNGSEALRACEMEKTDNGVWLYETENYLHGVYYDFFLSFGEKEAVSADPYAKACGVNGERSMIVDLLKTNPKNWENDKAPAKEVEDVIYELHVREFSYDEAGGFPREVRGKYKAFSCEGTTLYGKGEIPTGLDYIKSLGVDYIEIMPAFDYASVDETGKKEEFNWGYDPLNYNVPEGSYSTNPYDGEVRIREFKEMVQAIHNNGMRVIMDVVYNHTFDLNSVFEKTVPGYYYRFDKNGEISDGSACGNDIASEMPMMGKYILESVLYWAKEYHIDGFRFDLMGLLDIKLMNKIRAALDAEYGKGEKLMFGEPWRARETMMEKEALPADKKSVKELDENIGIFSDDIRDSIKGPVFYEKKGGFVNGDSGYTEKIAAGLTAWIGKERDKNKELFKEVPEIKAASQVISYVSCHDNHTLWDKLVLTTEGEELRLKQYRLAAAIYMCCQGRIFIYSGEEFLRTKGGIENSYNMSIDINKLDWNLIEKNRETVSYYRRLIAVRKMFSGLTDKRKNAYKNVEIIKKEKGFIAAEITAPETVKRGYEGGLIIFNADTKVKEINLGDGKYDVLVDTGADFTKDGMKKTMEGKISVPPVHAYILGRQ